MSLSSYLSDDAISAVDTEVVLAVLLRSFEFSLSEKEIVWNLGGVNYPTVDASSRNPSLPMVVRVVAP